MPRTKTYLKPGKEKLLVKMGRKENVPESAEEIMAGMKRGEERIGGSPPKNPPFIPTPETLDAEGMAQKRALQSLLVKYILPNSLSSKSSPEADRRSLINKLNRRTLKELRELVPVRIKRMSSEKLKGILDGTEEILDEEKVEIQNLYMDTSP